MALAHADAVTQCSPDIKPEIMELVKQSGLPFLPYQEPETLSEAYWQFYNSL